jgi:hypothetical protein
MSALDMLELPPRKAFRVVTGLFGLIAGCADNSGEDRASATGPVTASGAVNSVPASGPDPSGAPVAPTSDFAQPSGTRASPSALGDSTAAAPDESAVVNPTSTGVPGAGGDASPSRADAGAGGAPHAGGQTTGGVGGEPAVNSGAASAAAGQAGADGTADSGVGDAGSSGDGGATAGNTCQGGKVVHFVYFVEADQTYSESQFADIERQAYAFQAYFYEQLGVTFYLNQPVVDVIDAEHDSAWYVSTPDDIHTDSRWYRLGNIKKEVYSKLGIQDFDADHRVVNYPTTRHDGRVGGNFGGAWMDGDDLTCIADDGPTYPYDDGGVAHCMGHPAHEFGHILGLDHEGPDEDCMQYGFYTSTLDGMCDFSAANIEKILANSDNDGWFEALPAETCTGR